MSQSFFIVILIIVGALLLRSPAMAPPGAPPDASEPHYPEAGQPGYEFYQGGGYEPTQESQWSVPPPGFDGGGGGPPPASRPCPGQRLQEEEGPAQSAPAWPRLCSGTGGRPWPAQG